MKYNDKYGRWVSKDGLIYRYDKNNDKLVLCKCKLDKGYFRFKSSSSSRKLVLVHRAVYETFVGEIPANKQIDHIDTIKTNNKLSNLRCVTREENMNNPLTKKHLSETKKGHIVTEETKKKISETKKGSVKSDFGRKYLEHFGLEKVIDRVHFYKEYKSFKYRGFCSWEAEDKCKS